MAGAPASRTVRDGLVAFAKSILLLGGVPATFVRLWLLLGPTGHPWAVADHGAAVLVAHLALVAVGAGWLRGAVLLVRDLAGAFSPTGLATSSWSSRWALRLASLVLLVTAGAAAAATSRSRPSPVPVKAPASTSARAQTTVPENTPSGAPQTVATSRQVSPRPGWPEIALLGVGALLACAVVRRCRLLRRAAGCTRRPGERQRRPSVEGGRLEALLGPIGDAVLLDWIDGTSRLLWRSLRGGPDPRGPVDVRLVRAGPDGVELLLRTPIAVAPDGFSALDGGRWWCLDPDLDLPGLQTMTEGCGRYLPGLVPVGDDGAASYLLNIGPGCRLTLGGDIAPARRALSGIVLALRTLPWADELAVELLGIAPPPPGEQCYQLSSSSLEELRALAEATPTTLAARLAQRWSRQALVVSEGDLTEELEVLLGQCARTAGVVSLGGSGSDELVFDASGAWLDPLGIRLEPVTPSPEQIALVDDLLREAGIAPLERHRPGSLEREPPGPARLVALADSGPIEVRILGEAPHLSGAREGEVLAKDLPRVVEVVAYLHLHGGFASAAELQREIFGHREAAGSLERVHNVVAAARASLGTAPGGRATLTTTPGDSFHLDPSVSCDWDRFLGAVDAACGATPDDARRLLRGALGLVARGACCRGVAGYDWLVADGTQREMLATIVDAAHHLALLALAEGDGPLARWAVQQGSHVEPCSEMLVRDLMLACDADGDREGTARAWECLEETLAQLGGNEPSPETRELYATLLGPSTP